MTAEGIGELGDPGAGRDRADGEQARNAGRLHIAGKRQQRLDLRAHAAMGLGLDTHATPHVALDDEVQAGLQVGDQELEIERWEAEVGAQLVEDRAQDARIGHVLGGWTQFVDVEALDLCLLAGRFHETGDLGAGQAAASFLQRELLHEKGGFEHVEDAPGEKMHQMAHRLFLGRIALQKIHLDDVEEPGLEGLAHVAKAGVLPEELVDHGKSFRLDRTVGHANVVDVGEQAGNETLAGVVGVYQGKLLRRRQQWGARAVMLFV